MKPASAFTEASLSDEAARVFQEQGLAALQDREERRANTTLPPGPFKPLLQALHRLRADSAGGKSRRHGWCRRNMWLAEWRIRGSRHSPQPF